MTLSEAYNYGVYFLSANGVDEADFKSLCLCCHCAGIKNNEYEIHKNEDLIIMKKFVQANRKSLFMKLLYKLVIKII